MNETSVAFYIHRLWDLHSSTFDSYRAITPTIGPITKPQPTVIRPLLHFGAVLHPLSYYTYGCCPSMNFGSP